MKYWVRITTDAQHYYWPEWNGPFEDQKIAEQLAIRETERASELLAELVLEVDGGRGRRWGNTTSVNTTHRDTVHNENFLGRMTTSRRMRCRRGR